jgi:hypothetical protein
VNSPHPWIDAVLESFPKSDPKNEVRRDLLFEASTAVPRDWSVESAEVPPAPDGLRHRHLVRRLILAALLVLAALALLWTLWLSPDAQYRLRGIALTDSMQRTISEARLTGPLISWAGADAYDSNESLPRWLEDDLRRRIPRGKHAICLGRPGAETREDRWIDFWASAPDSPMVLADRARAMIDTDTPLTESFLAHAATHDPGNAYYRKLMLSGSTEACLLTVRHPTSGLRTSPPPAPLDRWRIDDPLAFQRAWANLEKLIASETCTGHIEPLARLRLADWPAPSSFPDLNRDFVWSSCYLPRDREPADSDAIELFHVKAAQVVGTDNPEELQRLCIQWRRHLRSTLDQESFDFIFNSRNLCEFGSDAMAEACDTLGMSSEAAFFREGPRVAKDSLNLLVTTWKRDPIGSSLAWRSSTWTPIDPAPGRLAEHRMFESLYLSLAATLPLVLGAITLVIRAMTTHRLLGLPSRLTALLRPTDHLRILASGILLPAAVVFATLEIPVLHPRPETFDGTDALAVLLKLAALVTAILMLTTRATLRALARRGQPLGFGPTASLTLLLLGLLALACAPAASIFLRTDLSTFTDEPQWLWAGCFGMLALILIVFLTGAIVLIFSGARRVQTATAARLLTGHLVVASVLIAAAVPIYRSIESRHVAHAMAERIDTPEALDAMLGRSPLHQQIRRIYLDYLATAPTE